MYGITKEQNLTDVIKLDFILIKNTIESSREFKLFIKTPIVTPEKKKIIFHEIFKGKLNELTLKFMDMLFEKNREIFLPDITIDFTNLINEDEGIIEANIKTAISLTDSEKNNLSEKLKGYIGKKIEANFTVDKDIKGGFIAQIDDTIIDPSIRRQLELLFEEFKKGSFTNN